jgi:hypothetical protein
MRMRKKGQRTGDLISAQEIACWAYCPEQWRLQYGLGLPAENRASVAAGNRHHVRKAVAERVASDSMTLGRLLVALALVALLLLLALAR